MSVPRRREQRGQAGEQRAPRSPIASSGSPPRHQLGVEPAGGRGPHGRGRWLRAAWASWRARSMPSSTARSCAARTISGSGIRQGRTAPGHRRRRRPTAPARWSALHAAGDTQPTVAGADRCQRHRARPRDRCRTAGRWSPRAPRRPSPAASAAHAGDVAAGSHAVAQDNVGHGYRRAVRGFGIGENCPDHGRGKLLDAQLRQGAAARADRAAPGGDDHRIAVRLQKTAPPRPGPSAGLRRARACRTRSAGSRP